MPDDRHHGHLLIAGAILAGAGGLTCALADIAIGGRDSWKVGVGLLITGACIMVWPLIVMTWPFIVLPFRAYARLHMSQWGSSDESPTHREAD